MNSMRSSMRIASQMNRIRCMYLSSTPSPPKLFDYQTVTSNLKPSTSIINAVEAAFGKLALGKVDVPIPMHIGIHETPVSLQYNRKLYLRQWVLESLSIPGL